MKIGMARGKEDGLACWHSDENGIRVMSGWVWLSLYIMDVKNGIKVSEISGIIYFIGNNC